jgi:site-specific recombinase XerD
MERTTLPALESHQNERNHLQVIILNLIFFLEKIKRIKSKFWNPVKKVRLLPFANEARANMQKEWKNAVSIILGVNTYATVHTLRHSFATHLLPKGVNLRYIQALLGHESSKTTEIFTHITGDMWKVVQSPLDGLKL